MKTEKVKKLARETSDEYQGFTVTRKGSIISVFHTIADGLGGYTIIHKFKTNKDAYDFINLRNEVKT